jgi:multiple sugar transport system substrate-binding protein
MRRTSLLSWLSGLALVAAACGAPSSTTPAAQPTAADKAPAASTSQQPVQLRFAWWGSQDRHNRTIKVIEMFQQKYPHISISYEFAGFQDHWTKMTTQATGQNLPDLMQQDYAYITQWASNNLLMPLDDHVNDGTIKLDGIPKASIDGGRLNGKLYAVNLGNNSQTIVLDVAAFEKAGVALPDSKWTWSDFERTAMELHSKLGIYGIGPALADIQLWKGLYLGYGQWPFSTDGKTLAYSDDSKLVDYLKMIMRLQEAGAAPPQQEEIATRSASVESRPIVPAKAAMDYMWSNQLVAVWTAAGEARQFKLATLPRGEGATQSQNYLKPSQFVSITKDSKHPKEAAMFIDFMTNDVEANKVLLGERGVPISPTIQEAIKPLLTPSQVETQNYIGLIEKEGTPLPPPDPAVVPKLDQNVYLPQLVDPVLLKQTSPEDAVTKFRRDATSLLQTG